MKTLPFLSRTSFGLPNYLLVAIALVAGIGLIPRAAREAHDSNNNRAEDWLPADYPESSDLRWFRKYFFSEGFIVVSWDGCTLGNTDKLKLLAAKLSSRVDTIAALQRENDPGTFRINPEIREGKWFREIITGPSMIEELTGPPLSLGYADAVRRLEGALIGPAKRDADGRPLGDETRTTCLVAYLAPDGYRTNDQLRRVVQHINQLAKEECGIPSPQLRMGGPPVDNVAIDQAGESSLVRLVSLSGIVGFAITYWCLGSFTLTGVVVAVGGVSAAMSLAFVFYYGVLEVMLGWYPTPRYGTMDAVLMTMPAVVYVLGLSGAIHLVNYYRDIRQEYGLYGAVEKAVQMSWTPCFLAAFTTAVGLGSLAASDIVPIKKFGAFTGVAVLATLAVLFSMLPVYLHRFPPKMRGLAATPHELAGGVAMPGWAVAFSRFITQRYILTSVLCLAAMVGVGFGVTQITSSVQLLKLLDQDSDLVQDYHWLENHMGNLVPMEVVVTVPMERCRSGDEHAEQDGQQYRLTMLERMELVRRILKRVEKLGEISRTLSASTFSPEASQNLTAALRRGSEYTINKNLEENRQLFRDYLRVEPAPEGIDDIPGRELWRVSARVTALKDIDYGEFVDHLHEVISPVLFAYRQRDLLIRRLHEDGKRLEGTRICVLFRADPQQTTPDESTAEGLLAELLREGGVKRRVADRQGNLVFFNTALLDVPEMTDEKRAEVIAALESQDAVVFVNNSLSNSSAALAKSGVPIVDLAGLIDLRQSAGSAANPMEFDSNEPRPIRAVYTGIIPLVYKTQSQLLVSLRQSIVGAVVLNWIVLILVYRSVFAALVAMIPNVFPIFLVFGALGWLGVKVEIGIMMTASVALGIAIDGTVHFITWYRDGLWQGLSRRDAVLMAYQRCAAAMTQTTLIAGLGVLVFAFSTFTPTQQFGYMMVTTLAAALAGDLILLPALLCGPLGRFFSPKAGVHLEHAAMDEDPELPTSSNPTHPVIRHLPQGEPVSGDNGTTGAGNSPQVNPPEENGDATEINVEPEATPGTSPHGTANASLREKLRKYRVEARHDSTRPR